MELALMEALHFKQNIIIPNVSYGISDGKQDLHECDLLVLSKTHYATEVEIKVSRHDLLKDKLKKHGHSHPYIKHLYYAVPEKLRDVALTEIPPRAGLYVIRKSIVPQTQDITPNRGHIEYLFTVERVRKPHKAENPYKWTDEEVVKLLRLGSMRIFTMKKAILRKECSGLFFKFKNYVSEHIIPSHKSQSKMLAR